MRGMLVAYLIEHWRVVLTILAVGLAAWGVLRLFKTMADRRQAQEEAARGRELDAEMAKIRETLKG
jgi:hypothetical protein